MRPILPGDPSYAPGVVPRLLLVAVVALTACDGDATATDTTASPAPTAVATTAPAAAIEPSGFERQSLTVTNADGTVCELCVWRAATADERRRGLMGVTELGAADGMVFVYDTPVTNQYWMRDTPLSLDIAWFDPTGALASTATMTPCLSGPADACARYGPGVAYTLALEVPAGRLAELGIGDGSIARLGAGAGCDTP